MLCFWGALIEIFLNSAVIMLLTLKGTVKKP